MNKMKLIFVVVFYYYYAPKDSLNIYDDRWEDLCTHTGTQFK